MRIKYRKINNGRLETLDVPAVCLMNWEPGNSSIYIGNSIRELLEGKVTGVIHNIEDCWTVAEEESNTEKSS